MGAESSPVVDAVDRDILSELARDPRASTRAIARAVGMSAGAVRERLDRLERGGVILGYRLDIDPKALGLESEALLGLELTQHQSLLETMQTLSERSDVVAVDMVTGRWDLVVRVRVSGHRALKDALTEIWSMPNVRHSESMVVLDSFRDQGLHDDQLSALRD